MHPADQAKIEHRVDVQVFVQVARFGPQTAQDLIDAGFINNSDDAVASMARLVDDDQCDWTAKQVGKRCMQAVIVAGWGPFETV